MVPVRITRTRFGNKENRRSNLPVDEDGGRLGVLRTAVLLGEGSLELFRRAKGGRAAQDVPSGQSGADSPGLKPLWV